MHPPAPRYTLEYPFGNILLKIHPSKKVSSSLLAWTAMWLILFPVAGYIIFSNVDSISASTAWLLGGMILVILARVSPAIGLLGRQLTGAEIVEITPQAVTIQSRIFGIKRMKTFDAGEITRLRAAKPKVRVFAFLKYNLGNIDVPATGPIVLETRGKEIRIGFGLDQGEGQTIVDAIHARLSKYK